MTVGTGSVHPG